MIITKAEAKAQGLKHFYTGKPCKHGHIGYRTYPYNTCVECNDRNTRREHERERRARLFVPEGFIGYIAALPNVKLYEKQFEAVQRIPFENLWLKAHNRI